MSVIRLDDMFDYGYDVCLKVVTLGYARLNGMGIPNCLKDYSDENLLGVAIFEDISSRYCFKPLEFGDMILKEEKGE